MFQSERGIASLFLFRKKGTRGVMKKKLAVLLIIALAFLTAACKSPEEIDQVAQMQQKREEIVLRQEVPEEVRVLHVTGTAKVNAKPDLAIVTLRVSSKAETEEEARAANAEKMALVIAAVEELRVAPTSVKTMTATSYPIQETVKNVLTTIAYEVSNEISVEVTNMGIINDIVSKAIEAGATGVSELDLQLLDATDEYRRALADAMVDAQTRAAVLAEAGGFALGKLQDAREIVTAQDNESEMLAAEEAAVANVNAPIFIGEIAISATVELDYAMQ